MPVTERELGKIWAQESATFRRAFPRTARVTLALADKHYLPHPRPRDLAWYAPNERRVYLTRAALRRDAGTVRGLLRHELGHASDGMIDEPGCERRADRLARVATGSPIRYTREGLQSTTRGTTGRPGWLHQ
jgi:hypothetical protein